MMEYQPPVTLYSEQDPDYPLIAAIAAGDAAALDALYARRGRDVLAYLASTLDDRALAEEVLQDVMLAVWRHAASFRGDSKVKTWLLVIARNRAINAHRKRAPHMATTTPLEEYHDIDATDTTPIERVERKQQRQLLNDAINRLPAVHREILTLVFYQQLSGAEIAAVLGISVGTVKSRLHRAKELLRRTLLSMGAGELGELSNA